MEWTFKRGRGRMPKRSLVGSLLVHGVVVVLALLTTLREPAPLTFITYEVEIVSPPPQQVQEDPEPEPAVQEEELRVERPEETPEPETQEEIPLPEAEPEPEPEEPEPTPPEPEPEPEPEAAEAEPAATEEPEEESELSGEDIEVRMEGLRQDFPEYYEGIITQIRRCFRPPPGIPSGLRTTVYFVIRPDGMASDVRFVEQSGNFEFDYGALAAIADCAGQGRFGPLPEGYPYERLPILFDFRPSGDESPEAGVTEKPVQRESIP